MNEEEAVEKMRDLQGSIETSMGYSRAGSKFPVLFMISLAGILGSFLIMLAVDIYNYYAMGTVPGQIPIGNNTFLDVSAVVLFLWLLIAVIFYLILVKAYRSAPKGRWNKDLDGGLIGIVKIIESEDWDETLTELRKAKVSFIVISIMQFVLYWALASIIVSFVYDFFANGIFGAEYNSLFISLISALIVVGLGDRSLKKSYRELWYMDGLIAELRWFYLEFQGSEL